jgi:WD40 repeat protein
VAFAPDGRTVAAGGDRRPKSEEDRGSVALWTVETGSPCGEWDIPKSSVRRLAFSPDGKVLAVAGQDRDVLLWDWMGRSLRKTLTGQAGDMGAMSFTSCGDLLATTERFRSESGYHSMIRLWDTASGISRSHPAEVERDVRHLAFAPGGRSLGIACDDGTVRIWAAGGSADACYSPGHRPAEAWAVAWIGSDSALASGGDDHQIRLWNLAGGEPSRALPGHEALVSCLAADPAHRLLVSGGYDKTIRFWDLSVAAPKVFTERLPAHLRAVAFSPDGFWPPAEKTGPCACGRRRRTGCSMCWRATATLSAASPS